MEQKILSLKDDKINSEVELIEYPVELRGGRNLLLNSGNFGTTVDNWYNNGGGLVIDTVEKYNGHNTIRTTVGIGIAGRWYKLENGKEYTCSALIKSSEVFTGSRSVPIHYHAGLNNVHQLKIQVLKFDTSYTTSDLGKYKLLYIVFKLTGDADSFRPFIFFGGGTRIFNIAYLKLEKGNKATPWTPAPEDLGLSYPNWVTEFKPSISENGILIGSFTENPNL